MSNLSVTLYDEETEVEIPVCVEYSTQPAEPEVGIPVAYGELQYVSAWIPAFGSIIFDLARAFESEIEEAMDDEVWENELRVNGI